MKICARIDVEEDFTVNELELLIKASVDGDGYNEVSQLLHEKFGGSGYISGEEIWYWAKESGEVDATKYPENGYEDIEWC